MNYLCVKHLIGGLMTRINFKILTTTILVLSITLLLGGCNTAAGFGKDLQKGGEKIQEAAQPDDMAGK